MDLNKYSFTSFDIKIELQWFKWPSCQSPFFFKDLKLILDK